VSYPRRILLTLAAPLLAFAVAGLVTSIILLGTGDSVSEFWGAIFDAPNTRNIVNILNNAAALFLSGLAAAIAFRMNLFNIGVEGQYRVATFTAAVFAGEALLPGVLNTVATILVAMLAGAAWAGIAGLLRVTRGVSEVISTIMLNAIALSLVAYLLRRLGTREGQTRITKEIPESAWVPGIPIFPDTSAELYGLSVLAIAAGVGFALLLARTRFGFDLRATGQSESAAVAAGVDVKRMVMYTMLLSGAVAGLIGMPDLLGTSHAYSSTIQTGIGFTGIAVALLGRNRPVGIALGALIFAYLSQQGIGLGLAGISPDLVVVTQGVVVLSVVIAYEVVARYRERLEQAEVARQLAAERRTEAVPA
jgi:simple sugar transport system permease protein